MSERESARRKAFRGKLWTGRRFADGRPELIEVPVSEGINSGRGLGHYLAKGLKPLEAAGPFNPPKGEGNFSSGQNAQSGNRKGDGKR